MQSEYIMWWTGTHNCDSEEDYFNPFGMPSDVTMEYSLPFHVVFLMHGCFLSDLTFIFAASRESSAIGV